MHFFLATISLLGPVVLSQSTSIIAVTTTQTTTTTASGTTTGACDNFCGACVVYGGYGSIAYTNTVIDGTSSPSTTTAVSEPQST